MDRYTSLENVEERGNKTIKTWFNVNMNNESEICDFASALISVLTKVCGYDEDELEEEWMTMSFDSSTGTPNLEGAEEFFNKYAEEVLNELYGLDEGSYDIFNFVETEEETKPSFGFEDDYYASALFPEGKKVFFDKIING